MTVPRHDMYTVIHKALRRMMYDLALRLGRLAPSDDQGLITLQARMELLYGFLNEHASHENEHIHPALEQANAALCERLVHGHDEITQEAADMQQLMSRAIQAGGAERVELVIQLRMQFEEALAHHLNHFLLEEREGNTALWAHCANDQLMSIHQSIQSSISPERFAEWLDEMIPAMNAMELAGMLGGMRANAPSAAVLGFEEKLRTHLGDAGLQAVVAQQT